MTVVVHARCACSRGPAFCGSLIPADESDTDYFDCVVCEDVLAGGYICPTCDGAHGNVRYVCTCCGHVLEADEDESAPETSPSVQSRNDAHTRSGGRRSSSRTKPTARPSTSKPRTRREPKEFLT